MSPKRMLRRGAGLILAVALVVLLTSCPDSLLKTYLARSTGFTGAIHVSQSTGSDDNRGTAAEPVATIRKGIEIGKWYLDDGLATSVSVLVAEGTYEQNSSAGISVKLVEGVSLYGGYAPDFSERDRTKYVSKIIDLSTEGEDIAAVRTDEETPGLAKITQATVIDGFTIVGGSHGSEGLARAVHLDASSPTITNNIIDAGGGEVALDIYRDSDPIVDSNTILGNTSQSFGYKNALFVGDNSLAQVTNNIIDGGAHGNCTGVLIWRTRCPVFRDNTVYGGDGETSAAVVVWDNADATIEDNLLDGGTGSTGSATGVSVSTDSGATLEGNTIYGGQAPDTRGIWIYDDSFGTVRGNDIDAGNATNEAFGVHVHGIGSGFYVTTNTVHGGSAPVTCAISVDGTDGRQTIERNWIVAGENSGHTTGVGIYEAIANITNNVIYGGDATVTNSNGIVIGASSTGYIRNNTICSGAGTNESFGIGLRGTESEIQNNIIFATGGSNQTGIHEHEEATQPLTLENNLFYDYGSPDDFTYYRDWDGSGDLVSASDINNMGLWASYNVEGDPEFLDQGGQDNDVNTMDDNDWDLSSDLSPAADGGMDLSAHFTDDYDGDERTLPWSIGAYEYDGP